MAETPHIPGFGLSSNKKALLGARSEQEPATPAVPAAREARPFGSPPPRPEIPKRPVTEFLARLFTHEATPEELARRNRDLTINTDTGKRYTHAEIAKNRADYLERFNRPGYKTVAALLSFADAAARKLGFGKNSAQS